MSVELSWTLAGLGLAVLVIRRRSVAVGLVAAQSLILTGLAVANARQAAELGAAAVLLARSVGLAAFLLLLITRTRERQLVRATTSPLWRAALGLTLALLLVTLAPAAGLGPPATRDCVLALIAFGLAVAWTRRATLFQILGVVLVENGLVLAALQLPGTSWLIEVGAAFDLTLIGLVAGVFHERIFAEFGAGDSRALRSLRD
jgi:hydrogenase-4 component E